MDHMENVLGHGIYGIVFWSVIVFVVIVLIQNILRH